MEVDNLPPEPEEDMQPVPDGSRYSSPGLPGFDLFPASADSPAPSQIGLGPRYSPVPTAGSVGDVQSYWLQSGHDTSEYNTEYEDGVADAETESQYDATPGVLIGPGVGYTLPSNTGAETEDEGY